MKAPRCIHCGRFMGLVGGVRRCSMSVPVHRGWFWEHY